MRRKLTKSERHNIHQKTAGHCAYCGCEITLQSMQVDHIIALDRGGRDEIENMMPACRSCNHYKHTLTLEDFRAAIKRFPAVLARDSVTYRNAVRFGVVVPEPHRVAFYFERMGEKEENHD